MYKHSPSIQTGECKTQNKRHSIPSQRMSATKDGAAHADSHFYHQKTFENDQEEHTWASLGGGQA